MTPAPAHTFTAVGPVSARIDIGARADIWVAATSRSEVTVDVTPRDPSRALDVRAAETTAVTFEHGRLAVTLKHWRRESLFSDGGAVVVAVEVPIGTTLDLYSGMGNLTADGEFGDATLATGMGEVHLGTSAGIRIKSGAGDISVDRATGPVDLATGSGTISAGELEGTGRIKNGNGETTVGTIVGTLEIKASNGNIVVAHLDGEVSARSANGSIRVMEAARGSLNATTTTGSIRVGVRPGTAAWLDLASKQGQVRNQLAAADAPADTSDSVRITARSGYGDVLLQRSTEEG
ncbi:DUF4097 family beta strand repeat-containing protein [Lacisediminihabitans changchengi]|uniref:DUF4097 family beta strand repeat protein n=1 Tax=Lacisediminihabitans changchengi TaxID=2787634 RepID=A0A934W421_9MICO|nr:DUF4097 family beta strand repeat-containing protein [Lacisediminihabitans changchengi]MBK4347055.1 DUF4097 family beta strand repeat protein [Lacisediminihabitans changchengi]MBK4347822.1 DUF4097 family beta strand repeat protein [Lacisediminihabitans changchengi]